MVAQAPALELERALQQSGVDLGRLAGAMGFSADGGGNVGTQQFVATNDVPANQETAASEQTERLAGENAAEPTKEQALSAVERFEEVTQEQAQQLEEGLVQAAAPAEMDKGLEEAALDAQAEALVSKNSPSPELDKALNKALGLAGLGGVSQGQGLDVDMNDVGAQNVGTQQRTQEQGRGA